jgi:hypothetical protein
MLTEGLPTMDKALRFHEGDTEFMKLAFDVTAYWTGSAYDHKEGLLHFYQEALALIGARLKFYEREDMEGAAPLAADTLRQLPEWLNGSDPTKDVYTLDLETSAVANLPSDMALRFWANEYPDPPTGMIRLLLPTRMFEEAPGKLVDLTSSLVKKLRFHSGHAGYTVNWDHRGEFAHPSRKRMAILARRFPGIDLMEIPATLIAIPTGMKRINWVTLLGNDLLAGKTVDLQGLDTRPLPHGVAIVAGERPKVGDVNRQEDMSDYHKVGRAVADLRSPDHIPFVADQSGEPQEDRTEEWLSHFDT